MIGLGQQINSKSQLLNCDFKIKNVKMKKIRDMPTKYEESMVDNFLIGSCKKPANIVKRMAPFHLYSPAKRINDERSINSIKIIVCRDQYEIHDKIWKAVWLPLSMKTFRLRVSGQILSFLMEFLQKQFQERHSM